MYSQDSEEKCKENHIIHTFRKKYIYKIQQQHIPFPVHMDNDMQVKWFQTVGW